MSNTKQTVACPLCKRKQPERTPDAIYWCEDCRCQFDPEDDGDYSDRNPSARLEREERRRKSRKTEQRK